MECKIAFAPGLFSAITCEAVIVGVQQVGLEVAACYSVDSCECFAEASCGIAPTTASRKASLLVDDALPEVLWNSCSKFCVRTNLGRNQI